MIGKAIYSKLGATSGVTALVSGRIYPEMAPQKGLTYPFIVYTADTREEVDHYSGGSGLTARRVTITCVDDDYAGVVALSEAVKTALMFATGTYGGVVVQGMFLDGQSDGPLIGDGTEQQTLYVIELDFLVWYEA